MPAWWRLSNIEDIPWWLRALPAFVVTVAAGTWTVIQWTVERKAELARLEVAQAKRVPSLVFDFTCVENVQADGSSAHVINVQVTNPGINPAILCLGPLSKDGVDDFADLLIVEAGRRDAKPRPAHYKRLGPTDTWVRVLIDGQSTKTIPYLVEGLQPGLYMVQFQAEMGPEAARALNDLTGAFDPTQPISWSATRYIQIGKPDRGAVVEQDACEAQLLPARGERGS